ncbi:MAG: hypothetical protein M1837_007378 [Sclerophora amabilis]|nr:MAG: hypothetical protein M1837_007378 [Sclerophora amabilis]
MPPQGERQRFPDQHIQRSSTTYPFPPQPPQPAQPPITFINAQPPPTSSEPAPASVQGLPATSSLPPSVPQRRGPPINREGETILFNICCQLADQYDASPRSPFWLAVAAEFQNVTKQDYSAQSAKSRVEKRVTERRLTRAKFGTGPEQGINDWTRAVDGWIAIQDGDDRSTGEGVGRQAHAEGHTVQGKRKPEQEVGRASQKRRKEERQGQAKVNSRRERRKERERIIMSNLLVPYSQKQKIPSDSDLGSTSEDGGNGDYDNNAIGGDDDIPPPSSPPIDEFDLRSFTSNPSSPSRVSTDRDNPVDFDDSRLANSSPEAKLLITLVAYVRHEKRSRQRQEARLNASIVRLDRLERDLLPRFDRLEGLLTGLFNEVRTRKT